jgi:hypothetical protein
MDFFSARLLIVCLVDTGRPRRKNMCDDCVIVFRARDREHAFARALEIGRSHETEYLNQMGERVRWALAHVVNLDRIGRRVDGEEVASALGCHESEVPLSFDHTFRPEDEPPATSFT